MKIVKTKQLIGFFCKECRQHSTKTARYMVRRFKEGRLDMFCSRECTDKAHSRKMQGENNPNFNGEWHGPPVSEIFTSEQLSKNTKAYIARLKQEGLFEQHMQKLHEGHKRFFSTEEGRAIRHANGVKSFLSQASGKRTSIEIKMAEELTARGIEHIEQYNLGDKFALDFFLPEYNIVIECDGDYWHTRPEAVCRDKRKNAYVAACGFSMYRFWEREINADVGACVDIVMAEINNKEAA